MSTDEKPGEDGAAASSKKRKAEDDPVDITDGNNNANDTTTSREESSSGNTLKKAKIEEDDTKEEPLKKGDDEKGEASSMDVEESAKPAAEEGETSQIASEENKAESSAEGVEEATKESSDADLEAKAAEESSHVEAVPPSDKIKERVRVSDKPVEDPGKNPYDSIRWTIVENDGKTESLIKLVALKSLFAKQLPKMPRAYIARLVFDRRHISLVILSDDPKVKDTDKEVIGSICYRPFPEMRFAEIAFCAVNSDHQVKGYGTKLMNLVKMEGARTGIEYFITYADNYAIGYFKKQGFSKSVSMPKGRYHGLIKDYDGGTMMECYVHPSISFTRIPEMLAAQRKFILSRIRLKANSTRVYDPLPQGFNPNLEGVSRANETAARAMAIPGMVEAGWTMADLMSATGQGKDVDRAKNALRSEMLSIVRKVEEQQFAWPFREPVDTTEVKDYLEVIKEPIDLSTIDKRIRKGDHYKSKQMLFADLMLMVNNCKLYNEPASTYVQCAASLEKYLGTLFIN